MPALQNLTHQPAEAPFTSQGSQDLMKLLPIPEAVSLSDLNIKYKWQFIISISLRFSDVLQVIGSKWYEGQPAKSVFLLTSTINQPRFNKSMLHRPPSHLLKRLRCWSQRKVQATWASEISWSCVSCWDLHDGLPILSIIKHKTSERHICPKPWKVEVFQ